jgi:hypothetical protein
MKKSQRKEVWRPVPIRPKYQASSWGRIKNPSGRLLKPWVTNGYWYISLGAGKKYTVHSLILLTFCGPRPDGLLCLHKNSNPLDCRLSNLRYGTRRQNGLDMLKAKSIKHAKAVRCVETGSRYPSIAAAARDCNCSPSTISRAVNQKRPAKGFHWRKMC